MARIKTRKPGSLAPMPDAEASTPDAVSGPAPLETMVVQGRVNEVLEAFGVAHVLTADGFLYGLNRHTPGVDIRTLQVGQLVQARVTRKLHRVLQAQLLA